MGRWILTAVAAYLLGSLNFGVIISKTLYHQDLRTLGSGNAGATNALRVMGKKLASLVFLGDVLKAVFACLLGRYLLGQDGAVLAMLFVMLGHMYPVFFGFRGGKGVLSAATAICMADWRVGLCLVGLFLLLVLATRFVSLGSVSAAALMPLLMWGFHPQPLWYTAVAAAVGIWIIVRHRGNLSRLLHGKESKVSFKK